MSVGITRDEYEQEQREHQEAIDLLCAWWDWWQCRDDSSCPGHATAIYLAEHVPEHHPDLARIRGENR